MKINVAELLKDCPKGMELDCTMYDNCTLGSVLEGLAYPIRIDTPDGLVLLNEYGCYSRNEHAKCIIFPKGKTTWEGFTSPCEFKDGDILFVESIYNWIIIYKESENEEKLHKYVAISDYSNYTYMFYNNDPLCYKENISKIRLATEEEKDKLFNVIKDNGYKWNPETKTLEKLIKPKFKVGDKIVKKGGITVPVLITKVSNDFYYSNTEKSVGYLSITEQDDWELVPKKFDINTLIPFESRVLVRNADGDLWKPAVYGFSHSKGHYVVGGVYWGRCIPYEDNEHLRGTTNDCDDFYKTW